MGWFTDVTKREFSLRTSYLVRKERHSPLRYFLRVPPGLCTCAHCGSAHKTMCASPAMDKRTRPRRGTHIAICHWQAADPDPPIAARIMRGFPVPSQRSGHPGSGWIKGPPRVHGLGASF
jgi:hypothetical protein